MVELLSLFKESAFQYINLRNNFSIYKNVKIRESQYIKIQDTYLFFIGEEGDSKIILNDKHITLQKNEFIALAPYEPVKNLKLSKVTIIIAERAEVENVLKEYNTIYSCKDLTVHSDDFNAIGFFCEMFIDDQQNNMPNIDSLSENRVCCILHYLIKGMLNIKAPKLNSYLPLKN